MGISDTNGQHKSEMFNPDQPGTFCWVSGTVTYPKPMPKVVKEKKTYHSPKQKEA